MPQTFMPVISGLRRRLGQQMEWGCLACGITQQVILMFKSALHTQVQVPTRHKLSYLEGRHQYLVTFVRTRPSIPRVFKNNGLSTTPYCAEGSTPSQSSAAHCSQFTATRLSPNLLAISTGLNDRRCTNSSPPTSSFFRSSACGSRYNRNRYRCGSELLKNSSSVRQVRLCALAGTSSLRLGPWRVILSDWELCCGDHAAIATEWHQARNYPVPPEGELGVAGRGCIRIDHHECIRRVRLVGTLAFFE